MNTHQHRAQSNQNAYKQIDLKSFSFKIYSLKFKRREKKKFYCIIKVTTSIITINGIELTLFVDPNTKVFSAIACISNILFDKNPIVVGLEFHGDECVAPV